MEVSRENWFDLVRAYRHATGIGTISEIRALMGYGVCPAGAITDRSRTLYEVVAACHFLDRIQTPGQYYNLPAVYVDAVGVIKAELHRLEAFKNAK